MNARSFILGSLLALFLALPARAQVGPDIDVCGLMAQTIECLEFWGDDGNFYRLDDTSGLNHGDRVRVVGIVTLPIPPLLPCGLDGTITTSLIEPCGPPDFCFGDGGDQLGCTDCPCSNNAAQGSGGGCLNSAGASATLTVSGSESLASSQLCFGMTGGNPGSFAILTSGTARAPASIFNPCFGQNPGSGIVSNSLDGLRCVVSSVLRHGSRAIDANGEVGITTNSWGFCSPSFPNAAAFVAGQSRYFQTIYRDEAQAVCQTGQNTTQGIAVAFTP